MGAIALLLSRSAPPDPETARRMLGAAPHRGGQRSVEVLGQVAAGVCNDPDWETASLARGGEQMALFCGALDNEAELKADLRRDGAAGREMETPAATLLAAHRAWGSEAVPRLRGSFAGAVTDGRELRCFRDQFGLRPLYLHDSGDELLAATEVKQVLAGAPVSPEPNLEHLHRVVFGGVGRSTAYRGVERVPGRTVVRAGPEPDLDHREYWDPASCVETASLGIEEAAEGTREALERAVERVRTGTEMLLLSGGLDSPALAAAGMRAEGRAEPLRALTAAYPDHPSADEREWTRLAADHLGVPLDEYVAEAGSLDDVEAWVAVLDGPVDVLSIPESAEAYAEARARGARTVINGEMAEMLFHSRSYLLDHLLSHGRAGAAARELSGLRAEGWTRWQLARQIVRAFAPPRLLSAYASRRSRRPRGLPTWIDAERLRASGPERPTWSLSPGKRWASMQTAMFEGPSLAFEADEICAATRGVDTRRPFADVDLWEFVLSLPAEVKFPNRRTKPLLRKAMRGLLPDELIDRTDKTYFDEFHLASADYPTLRRLLVDDSRPLEGIDYGLLEERLEAGEMQVQELQWARDVARVHAFLRQW